MVVKISFKIRKNGVWWIYGELADFHIKQSEASRNVLEQLKGSAKKVRVMLPLEYYNSYQPISSRYSGMHESRSSTSSSTVPTTASSFLIDGLIRVDTPTLLTGGNDDYYVSVACKSLKQFE